MTFRGKSIVIGLFLISLLGVTVYLLGNQEETSKVSKSSQIKTESKKQSSETMSQAESTQKEIKSVDEQLNVLLKDMSIDQKIGQLFLARVPEQNALADIKKFELGGYLLFGRDMENQTSESLKNTIQDFKNVSLNPFMIASDEEGGTVTRISTNSKIVSEKFKSPQTLFKNGGMNAVLEDTKKKSELFKDLGIHTGLFPVADVSTDPESFIYNRTIGLDVKGTSSYVADVVKELGTQGVGSTLKHFPGYGDNRDSHTEIVRDMRLLDDIESNSLPPFRKGIEAGADSVLVSHNIVEAIDPDVPASISPNVHKMLRKELAFKGVIMTDDMDMAGLADFISQDKAALAALKAGNDLILSSSYNVQIPVIKEAIQSGDYSEEQLNESVLRVLTWKHKLGIIKLEE